MINQNINGMTVDEMAEEICRHRARVSAHVKVYGTDLTLHDVAETIKELRFQRDGWRAAYISACKRATAWEQRAHRLEDELQNLEEWHD